MGTTRIMPKGDLVPRSFDKETVPGSTIIMPKGVTFPKTNVIG